MIGHGFIYNKEFTIDGVKCEYCGQMIVGDDNHSYHCVVIKVENLSRINSWNKPISGNGNYSFDLLKKYGIEFTDYGIEQVRNSGRGLWPATFANGKMTSEITRADIRQDAPQEFLTEYNTLRNKGGGYVVLSPLVSILYTMGNLFKK